jgi:thioredoxin-like negative regulator of GroEL
VVFVHVDEERDYALKMGVTMIPTQILIDKNGREVSRHVGYIPVEDCEKMINKAGTLAQGKVCGPGTACK